MSESGEHPYSRLATNPVRKRLILPGEGLTVRRLGELNPDAMTVYCFHDVSEELIFSSEFRRAHTTAGILTGGYYLGPAGEYVELRGFRDVQMLEETSEFAEHLKRDWKHIVADSSLTEKGLRPIGWFVSRPGCHAEIGPFELILHLSYFSLPYQVLLMLDPLEQKVGLYILDEADRLVNIGFNMIEAVE